jgi:cell division protein FtsQ
VEALAPAWRPRAEVHPREWLARVVPTRRSLALGLGVLAVAIGGYLIARETALFSIERIEVYGASPRVAGQVRNALASVAGTSLVGLDGSAVLRKVDALPTVVSASYDRAFPHTLRITVVPEQPAAVLRSGADSWLVSTRGRVIERLPFHGLPRVPRVWVSSRTAVGIGDELTVADATTAAHAVGLSGRFAARVASASYTGGTVVFRLRSGLTVVLGDGGDIKLKVAVAARLLPKLPLGSTFLDVSIPGRPVSGTGSPLSLSPSVTPASSSRG